jgi:hypothetical protein
MSRRRSTQVSLSELSQTADLIFVGTVEPVHRLSATKTMPVTDVVFGDIRSFTRRRARHSATPRRSR